MPLFYTHIRFANQCINLLQPEYQNIIENNLVYYLYGAQGPNIFKYHSPLTNRQYAELSNTFHNSSIVNTLKKVKSEFNNNKDRDAILSYIFGYITHYILDSYTYSYLNISSNTIKVNIDTLKSEIDKYYINRDKIDINIELNKYKNTDNINITIGKILNSKENIIKQSLINMIQYSKIIYIKNTKLIKILKKILKIFHLNKYDGLLVNGVDIVDKAQILRFEKYFEISKLHYQLLINNFIDYIFNNTPLDEYYLNTFIVKNTSPVLDFDKEKTYIISDFNR